LFSVISTASSVLTGSFEKYGPQYAIDGLISEGTTIGDTIQSMRSNPGSRWLGFQNVAIHVGDQPAGIGGLVTNPECAIFEGPSATGRI
jgi:hypothetical protein